MTAAAENGPGSAPSDEHATLSEHVLRNVHMAAELHVQSERSLSRHQRAIESATSLLGRPAALYGILAGVALWTLVNTLAPRLGLRPLDPPPFVWLQGLIGLSALLATTSVLGTQQRQLQMSERRMHLDLQVNLLTEQKVAKLIELVEELRRDLPNVRDRRDPEADAMQHAAEPLEVIAALEARTLEVMRDGLEPEPDPDAPDPPSAASD
jgi:uncharacterized membrane protein